MDFLPFFILILLLLLVAVLRVRQGYRPAWRQHELLTVQIELNEELDHKVRERTQALELANNKLQLLSTIDELTNLYNRRYINNALIGEYRRAARDHTSLSLLMIDLDHFKRINDEFGASCG